MNITFANICGSITAVGLIFATSTAIVYLMRLPIFDETVMAWAFVAGLGAAATAIAAFAIKSIWAD